VLPQSNEYFARFLEKRNGLMVGVVCNGQLISQIVLMGPITLEDAIARNAITRNEIPFHHAQSADLIVVAKSMAVHPEWRGNELSQLMLDAALDQPLARTADHVFAQISADNVRSWELFMRNGFGIVAAAIDPLDNQPRFVMQKPALGLALHSTPSVDNINPLEQFSTILRVTGLEALIGQLGPRDSTLSLSFFAGQATAAAWTEEVANA
jgi:ribosomal protein S18 acetylase RimI-like enzyme